MLAPLCAALSLSGVKFRLEASSTIFLKTWLLVRLVIGMEEGSDPGIVIWDWLRSSGEIGL